MTLTYNEEFAKSIAKWVRTQDRNRRIEQAKDHPDKSHWDYDAVYEEPVFGETPDFSLLRQAKAIYALSFALYLKAHNKVWDSRNDCLGGDETLEALAMHFELSIGIDAPPLPDLTRYVKRELDSDDPVRMYLGRLPNQVNYQAWDGWDTLAAKVFGTDQAIHQIMLSKWLIAAVARVFKPGVKADNCLVLQGEQGIGKTSFFSILGDAWFSTIHQHTKDADRTRQVIKHWILELGELEGITRKTDQEALKAFISETADEHRLHYKNQIDTYPRRCILGATANSKDILQDSTGSRRYWAIPAAKVDLEFLKANRDQIWAEAVRRYQRNEKHWLDQDEAEAVAESNKAFQADSGFETPLEVLTAGLDVDQETIVPSATLYQALGIKDQARRYSKQIGAALAQLGWQSVKKRIQGVSVHCYVFGQPSVDPNVISDVDRLVQAMSLDAALRRSERPSHLRAIK